MKKLCSFLLFAMIVLGATAQSIPQGINYQAVARNAQGEVLAGQTISLQVSLIAGTADGKEVYREIHRIRTSETGVFNLIIGEGETRNGLFADVPWAEEQIWLGLAIDEQGGDRFVPLSTTRLLAVPYAFHAGSAETLHFHQSADKAACPITGLPFWSILGNNNVTDECHFIGTTIAEDLIFKTDDIERMRIRADGTIEFIGDVFFGGNVEIAKNLTVGQNASVGQELAVGSNTQIGGDLNVDGNGKFLNLEVINDASIGNDLNVTGNTTASGRLNANGRLVVTGGASGDDSDINSYPAVIQGSNQGLAIKINGTRSNSNNFISFLDDQGMWGRIEGQTVTELATSPEYIIETAILSAEVGMATADLVGASTSGNACGGVGAVACPPIASLIAAAAANEVVAIANLAAYEAFAFDNIGITYESGAGDYAEWLERQFPEEQLSPGDIVGVNGGKITRFTREAEKFMVVSAKPAVLGNMPKAGEEQRYNKVAFLGQIPVKVRGKVNTGDYIIPSGFNDGTGKAVAPDDLSAAQYPQIVGTAWSAFNGENTVGMVNLAVGINANEVARLAARQESRINELEQELQNTQAVLKELLPQFAAMKERMDQLETHKVTSEPEPALTTEALTGASRPVTLDPELIEEAIVLAEKNLRLHGVDIDNVPGMKRLFEDTAYRQEMIQQILQRYQTMKRYMDNIDLQGQ